MLAVALAACSPAYAYKAWRGQRRLLASRRPVAEVLADPAAPAALRAKLELVQAVRAFAAARMAMPPSKSYADYVDVGRPYVTLTVTAAPKTALEPYEWWFPAIGRVPYKGYFDEADARREEARLRERGYDTYVARAQAYSTLGWWRDPVLSTMIEDGPGDLAETLLHELAHEVVYLRGQGDFNESLATYAGERGAEEFLAERFGPGSAELAGYRRDKARRGAVDRRVAELCRELEALYASPVPDTEKLAGREVIFTRARGELDALASRPGTWPPLNNAVALAFRRYSRDLDAFRRVHEAAGGWAGFWAHMRAADRKRPWDSLRAPRA